MHILTLRIASRHVPKAGAVCSRSARTDLGGGRQVTAVPNATDLQWLLLTIDSYESDPDLHQVQINR